MEEVLGQPVQVVNRGGAGGTVGIQSLVLPADPDGYTIAASASVSLIENPILQGLAYGPEDLTIIGTTGQFQVAIVASADAPYDTWEDFVAYARENPNTRWYALGQVTVPIMTLEPGDIITTGTPAGVGFGMNPQVFLKPGDLVEVTIEGLGTQRQTVVAGG